MEKILLILDSPLNYYPCSMIEKSWWLSSLEEMGEVKNILISNPVHFSQKESIVISHWLSELEDFKFNYTIHSTSHPSFCPNPLQFALARFLGWTLLTEVMWPLVLYPPWQIPEYTSQRLWFSNIFLPPNRTTINTMN